MVPEETVAAVLFIMTLHFPTSFNNVIPSI